MIKVKWDLNLKGAVLIANPVPQNFEMKLEVVELFILKALEEAKKQGISGKAVTPFLLKYIANNSDGESLETNIELIKNNAKLGALISVALSKKE